MPAASLLVCALVVTAAGLGEAVFSEPLQVISFCRVSMFCDRGLTLAEAFWIARTAARVPMEEIFMVKYEKYYRLPERQYGMSRECNSFSEVNVSSKRMSQLREPIARE